ncbi:MAG: hypothetical protein AAFN91_19475 [Pseudomonadota bacterium]
MSRDDRPTLDRAWPIICQLISLLRVYVPRLAPIAPDRVKWQHLTRLAESLIRRWLVLNACQESGWPHVRVRATRLAPVRSCASRQAQQPANRPPRFPLEEAERPLARLTLTPDFEGSSRFANSDERYPMRRFNPARLQRRLAALTDVMNDPVRHTARMIRWLARAAARRQQGTGRICPFRVGWPPGASRYQQKQDPVRQDLLSWLNILAREAVERRPP